MPLPLILLAAEAAAQPAQMSPPFQTGVGHAFVSPMGEPFLGRANGGDGLSAWFAQTDSNHDGSITAEEMAADAQHFFQALDTNKDGEIDPDEVTHYEMTIQARGGRYSLLNIPEPVISADANFNRGVSVEEFRSAAARRFQLLDFNHSGRLTLSDLETVREAAASQAKHPFGEKRPDIPLDPKGDTESIVPPR